MNNYSFNKKTLIFLIHVVYITRDFCITSQFNITIRSVRDILASNT